MQIPKILCPEKNTFFWLTKLKLEIKLEKKKFCFSENTEFIRAINPLNMKNYNNFRANERKFQVLKIDYFRENLRNSWGKIKFTDFLRTFDEFPDFHLPALKSQTILQSAIIS